MRDFWCVTVREHQPPTNTKPSACINHEAVHFHCVHSSASIFTASPSFLEHMELAKCYRELTDLCTYYKRTQLETMVSEKAATEFQLEKEIKRLQEAQAEAERSRVSRRASSFWEDETEIKSLEPLTLHHRHRVGASIQLQKAVKLLDSGAVRVTRFLWRYPIARVWCLYISS